MSRRDHSRLAAGQGGPGRRARARGTPGYPARERAGPGGRSEPLRGSPASGGATAADLPAGRPGTGAGEWRVVLPVLDEAEALPGLLAEMAAVPGLLARAVFVDNGSTDGSGDLIRAAGGRVVTETRRGYGYACLAGVETAFAPSDPVLAPPGEPDGVEAGSHAVPPARDAPSPRRAVVFMEADGSDDPADLPRLVGPVVAGDVDLLVGSRRGALKAGASMAPHQRWGNAAAVLGMRVLFGVSLPDNGPFRAIDLGLLQSIGMEPRGYAWTTEMVLKAHLAGARLSHVETAYRARTGKSKISGTVRGTLGAFRGIFGTMLRLRLSGARPARGVRGRRGHPR